MLTDGGRGIGINGLSVASPWRSAAMGITVMVLLAVAPAASNAQPPSFPITEEEVYLFLGGHFDALAACEVDRLASHFSDSARFQFTYSDGRQEVLTRSKYLERIRQDCRAYQGFQWDRSSTEISTGRDQATVNFQLAWGGRRGRQGNHSSTLIVESRIELVREHGGLLIDEVQERFRELAPGAEKAFWGQSEKGTLFSAAVQFYHGAIEMTRDAWRRYREQHPR